MFSYIEKMSRHATKRRFPVGFFLFLLSNASVLFAQYVELSGRVTDPQGRLIVGASVRLEKNGADVVRIKSDEQGNFRFYDIPPGNYALRAEAPGFAPATREIHVQTSKTEGADLQFERVASQSQNIVITAKSLEPEIDMRNAEVFNRTLFTRDDQLWQGLLRPSRAKHGPFPGSRRLPRVRDLFHDAQSIFLTALTIAAEGAWRTLRTDARLGSGVFEIALAIWQRALAEYDLERDGILAWPIPG